MELLKDMCQRMQNELKGAKETDLKTQQETIATGYPNLDEVLGGGLPVGKLIVLSHHRKERIYQAYFFKQIICLILNRFHKENSGNKKQNNLAYFSYLHPEFFALELLKIKGKDNWFTGLTEATNQSQINYPIYLHQLDKTENLPDIMEQTVHKLGCSIVCLDMADIWVTHNGKSILDTLIQLQELAKQLNVCIFVSLYKEERDLNHEQDIADIVLSLDDFCALHSDLDDYPVFSVTVYNNIRHKWYDQRLWAENCYFQINDKYILPCPQQYYDKLLEKYIDDE